MERKHAKKELSRFCCARTTSAREVENRDGTNETSADSDRSCSFYLSLDRCSLSCRSRARSHDVDTVVILLREEDNCLVSWAAKGMEVNLGIRVPMGAGFAGRVAEQKAPIVIDDIDSAEFTHLSPREGRKDAARGAFAD